MDQPIHLAVDRDERGHPSHARVPVERRAALGAWLTALALTVLLLPPLLLLLLLPPL